MRELRAYARTRGTHRGEESFISGSLSIKAAVSRDKTRLRSPAASQSQERTFLEFDDAWLLERPGSAHQDISRLHLAINELPVDIREAFRVVCLQGLSYEAAAQRLHLRPWKVRRHVAHALAYCASVVESTAGEGLP